MTPLPLNAFMEAAARLSPESVDRLAAFYAEHCEFRDPFQAVHGRAAVAAIYRNMFEQLHAPRFTNVRRLGQADPQAREVVIAWDFEFALGKTRSRQSIAGASLLRWDSENKIREHTDYWDASRLMQGLPVVGGLIGWLRQKIGQAH